MVISFRAAKMATRRISGLHVNEQISCVMDDNIQAAAALLLLSLQRCSRLSLKHQEHALLGDCAWLYNVQVSLYLSNNILNL